MLKVVVVELKLDVNEVEAERDELLFELETDEWSARLELKEDELDVIDTTLEDADCDAIVDEDVVTAEEDVLDKDVVEDSPKDGAAEDEDVELEVALLLVISAEYS